MAGVATWRLGDRVALSSTKAEYRVAAVVACEVAWLELLLGDLGIQVQRSVVIYCDNLSSIQLEQNPVFHGRTKHIEVHYHFIKERVLDGSINLTFVRIDEQVADIFTKAFGAEKLRRFRVMLGVRELELSLRGVLSYQAQLVVHLADSPLTFINGMW
ncbi:hypothetical protein L7F22_000410 [Adiantum nelumboides]|nr:hypothetical protein [Adiantum nelumboides]